MLKKVVLKIKRGQVIGSIQTGMLCVPASQWAYRRGQYNIPDEEFTEIITGFDNLDVGDDTSYVVPGLIPGTNYYYRVPGCWHDCSLSSLAGYCGK